MLNKSHTRQYQKLDLIIVSERSFKNIIEPIKIASNFYLIILSDGHLGNDDSVQFVNLSMKANLSDKKFIIPVIAHKSNSIILIKSILTLII